MSPENKVIIIIIIIIIVDLMWHNTHTLLSCFCLFVLLWSMSNCHKVLQVSCHFDSSKWWKILCDPELTELTPNHRTWCMLLCFKYCTRSQCCCIWLICKTFQSYVSFKLYKGLFYLHDYYNWVRRFVVSDPELPDSLYCVKRYQYRSAVWNQLKQRSRISDPPYGSVSIIGHVLSL